MFDITKIGENIRYYRKRNGFTQNGLAERLHVSFQAVSGWECGTALPDLDNLCRLATLFGVSLDTLVSVNFLGDEQVMIGVDGGGTKTEFVLFTSAGHVLGRVMLPGSNESVVGFDSAVEILQNGIDLCLGKVANVVGIFLGIAGGHRGEIEHRLRERYPSMCIFVESDACNALSSAKGDAALICGTGSILIYRTADGYDLKGGWGYRMGDPGSAYNIGREAIRAALAIEDGMRAESAIYPLLKEKMETACVHTCFAVKSVSEIAALSTAVFAAHRVGDATATEILENEMRALAPFIEATCRASGRRMIVCGGVMEHHSHVLLPMLRKYVSSDTEFIFPKLPPVYGACVECCLRQGLPMGEAFGAHFEREYTMLKTNT
ncbi:MAG: XRE family transcriptional regulator [Clostridia bacterium]|nr:XRE family transcriptional regulator [Clostridia bacterium]